MPLSLEMIMLIIIFVVMIISILVGVIQGFRKNFYGLVSTIIFWIVFFVTAPLLANSKIWYDEAIYQKLGLDPSYSNLMVYLEYTIANSFNLDIALFEDPAFENTLIAFALNIIRIVYLIVLSIGYNIVMSIIYRIFFAPVCKVSGSQVQKLRKKVDKQVRKNGKADKKLEKKLASAEKRYKRAGRARIFGMVSGFFRGAISCFIILSLVNSLVGLLPERENESITASNEQSKSTNVTIYDYIAQNYPEYQSVIDYITDYQQSNLSRITSIKVNGQPLDTLLIDAIITGKKEDCSVSIRKELQQIIKIGSYAFVLTNGFDMENFDYYSLDEQQVELVQNILYILSEDDLVKNLGSLIVALSLTMSGITDQLPEEVLEACDYKNIDLSSELTVVADIVSYVYGLGNLNQLDYTQIPEENFVGILSSLASLQSIQLIGTIGAYFGLKSASLPEENLKNIEAKLVDICWSEDIFSISELYNEYKSLILFYKENMSEEQQNALSLIFEAPTEEVQSVMDTLFETSFLETVLPDVLTIVRSKINPTYASLINPNVTLSSQWKNELDTVFTILKQLKGSDNSNPFENMTQFDFSILGNLSTDTIMSSELLTYAVIHTLIEGSNGSGLVPALQDYLVVPDNLKTYDEEKHEYSKDWYGKDGELYIVFDTLKNALSKIESIKYPANSFAPLLQSIDATYLMQSDVLYCTIDQFVKRYNDYLVLPEDCLQNSELTVNEIPLEMITREEFSNILSIFCGENNILDLEKLYVYYRVDEEGNETRLEGKPEDGDYIVKLDIKDTNKLLSMLTSERIYQKENDIDNTAKLFQSNILRATLSNFMEDLGAGIIVTPSSLSSSAVTKVSIYNPSEKVHLDEEQKLSVLSTLECANLIKAFINLDLDLADLQSNPLSIIDTFKEEDADGNVTYQQEKVNDIFGRSQQQTYSELLHATLSKFINDFASESQGSSLELVVPEMVLENTTNYITSDEIVNLVKALVYVDINELSKEGSTDAIANEILNNENIQEAFDSIIFRATISQFMVNNAVLIVPNEDQEAVSDCRLVKKESLSKLIKAIQALNIQNFSQIGSDPLSIFDSFVDEATGEFNQTLANSIFQTEGENYSSILHAMVSSQLNSIDIGSDSTLVIPSTVYDSRFYDETHHYVNGDELVSVVKAICTIKDELSNSTTEELINNLIRTEKISATYDSIIFRATITKMINNLGGGILVIPAGSYEVLGTDNVVYKADLQALVHDFNLLNLDVSTISSDPLSIIDTFKLEDGTFNQTLAEQIFTRTSTDYSYILHATLSNCIDDLATSTSDKAFKVIIPNIYDEDSYLPSHEIIHLLQSLVYVDIEGLTNATGDILDEVYTYMNDSHFNDVLDSIILRATLSNYITSLNLENAIIIPNDENVCDLYGSIKVITKEEILRVKDAINSLGGLASITDLGSIVISNLATNKESIFASYILKASFSQYIMSYTETDDPSVIKINVPGEVYQDPYITDEEIYAFIDAIAILNPGSFSTFNQFGKKDLAAIERTQIETFFNSKIVVATTSPMVYDEFVSIHLEIPEPLTRDNMTKEELVAIYMAMDVLLLDNQSIADADLTYDTILSSDLFDNSEEDKVLLLCQSKVIASNLVKFIKEENTTTLNSILRLETHRDGTIVDWYYQSDLQKGELYDLLYALHALKSQGYYSALTTLDPATTELSLFKTEGFITTITNNHILCDAIPDMLLNFKSYFESGNQFIDLSKMYVNEDGDKVYWGGEVTYTEGELYRFFDAISAANRIKNYNLVSDIDNMCADINVVLSSEVTSPMIVDYLTNETLVNTMNQTEVRIVLGEPAYSCPLLVIPATSWESTEAQEYLRNFVTIYLTAVQKGVSL